MSRTDEFNPGPDEGPKPPKGDAVRVRVHVVWEGSMAEARRFGAFTRRLVSDFDGDPERRHALRLRNVWREAAAEAGVKDG